MSSAFSSDRTARARAADWAPWLVLAASIATLGGAFAFQYLGGLAPCPLCLTQRYPYAAAIVLAVAALAIPRGPVRRWLMALCAAAFAVGAGFGVWHAGIEYGWFAGPTSCTTPSGGATSIEALREQLMATPVVACDQVPWSLFGVSLAGYNALIAAGLCAYSIFAAASMDRSARP